MPRPIWSGSISFGLVNIPVRVFSATGEEAHIDLDMLHKKDLSRIRYARVCKAEEKEVPYEEIVKGYEVAKDQYVILTEEDFKQANVKKTKTIEILDFAEESEIDSLFFDKPYYMEPDKGAAKAYALLRDALRKSGKVGIARFVLRDREHIAIIKPYEDALVLNQLRYYKEIRPIKDLDLPKDIQVSDKEMQLAIKLIQQLTSKFKPEKYHDTYIEELKALIARKAKGKGVPKAAAAPKVTKVHDIMDMLKASLEETPTTKPTRKQRKPKKAA